ncbi:EscU/YscU/HrcU family type III secretion system export apparatus switch protein [Sandaracinobacteroides saxicola]|uniref:Flagellar biosynthesis protein FlhB n=1 Tax=Sandaracinobacteroides saxicola TaxID=2759707 RepID=A0A7G5IK02_9SPHN|nr:flagellar type III secretion system protein FlhB [Sandaracinobacteroides saxicola]QMW23694.1 flagellar biosynthesis protein FlhB [Sandaracinobacteroides saxicola]
MADETEQSQKTEPASEKKIDDAAKKGDVPIAADVRQLAMFGAVLALAAFGLDLTGDRIGRFAISFWGRAELFTLGADGGRALISALLAHLVSMLAIPLAIAMVAVGVAGAAQGRLLVSATRIKPQLSRISPLAGFKRLFGAEALVQFAKTLLKIVVVGWVIAMLLPDVATLIVADTPFVGALAHRIAALVNKLVWGVVIATAAVALIDLIWVRLSWARRQRMSREDVKNEHKSMEGDPLFKARRRAIAIERSRRNTMAALERATVLVMNPTHFAVALRYDHAVGDAPLVVAKGIDSLALAMRTRAQETGIEVVEDPPLARSLHATVEVDQRIPPELFEAVARVITMIMAADRDFKARG